MARREVHEREERVVSELCDFLALREGVEVHVTGRPDREPGASGGCDALIDRGGIACAVEVTRLFPAWQHPRTVKRLEEIRPIVAARVVAARPHAIVMVGVPVEEFHRGVDWQELSLCFANAAVDALRDLQPNQRVPVTVRGISTPAFVQVLWDRASEGFCAVNPAVWGRDPEELACDEVCRALSDKRASMRGYQMSGKRTILLLDCEWFPWAPYVSGLFAGAIEREDPSAYDEIYAALSAFTPSFLIPLKLDAVAPVDQPTLGEFIELRTAVDRLRER